MKLYKLLDLLIELITFFAFLFIVTLCVSRTGYVTTCLKTKTVEVCKKEAEVKYGW